MTYIASLAAGFVFKMQANLDPNHRDRLAYVRVVSGKYEKGMKVKHSRSKSSKTYNLAAAQALFGQNRESIEEVRVGGRAASDGIRI